MLSVRMPFVLFLLPVGLSPVSAEIQVQDERTQQLEASTPLTLAQLEALNATLAGVLRAACNQTGTAVDVPAGVDEPVVGIFGPGPPQEVLASLLNGSRFNYVMVGSPNNANRVVRLTLSAKPVGPLDGPSPHPAAQLIAKAAEAAPIPRPPPAQLQTRSAEASAPDVQAPRPLPPRRRGRR